MKNRICLPLLLLAVSVATPAQAEHRYIVRAPGGLNVVQAICRLLGCNVIRGLADPAAQLFLVSTSDLLQPVTFLFLLTNQIGITNAEIDLQITVGLGDRLSTTSSTNWITTLLYGSTVWNDYAAQPAASIIRLQEGRNAFGALGSGVVAVIDTGIDPTHPALSNVVVPGYDFIQDQPGMAPPVRVNEWDSYSESTAAVVDGPMAFGHGTFVAGVVHLVAPRAQLMSLKTFRPDGTAYLSDVLRAIYFAARSTARVINMSFSIPNSSSELKNALDVAVSRQLICVAAAGNDGRQTMVYPAGFDNTMGVASTNLLDGRSIFSNYGDSLVWVAAPGEEIVSTYPSNSYATGFGTSFSAPFVSGAVALVLDLRPGDGQSAAAKAISNAQPVGPGLGYGRLDIYRALQAAQLSQ
jgi:subtilisin family serine protease